MYSYPWITARASIRSWWSHCKEYLRGCGNLVLIETLLPYGLDPQHNFTGNAWFRSPARLADSAGYDESYFRQWGIQKYYIVIDLNIGHTVVDRAYSQKRASVSDDEPVVRGGGMNGGFQSNKEPAIIAAPAWQSRTLAFFTMYGELSTAFTPEEFALVRVRLEQEWTFGGGFVGWFIIIFLSTQLICHSIS